MGRSGSIVLILYVSSLEMILFEPLHYNAFNIIFYIIQSFCKYAATMGDLCFYCSYTYTLISSFLFLNHLWSLLYNL